MATKIARSRVTEYVKSDDEAALQSYVDGLRENGDNVIGPAAGRAGVGTIGFWYACLRNGDAFGPVVPVVQITRIEGAQVVGKWAGG